MIAAILILLVPVFGENPDDTFSSWKDTYYNQSDETGLKDLFEDLTLDELSESDFSSLDYIYEKVFGKNSTERMADDFKSMDSDNNNKLSYEEFRDFFNPIYQFYKSNPQDYRFFVESDIDANGLISLDELEEISYVFCEDSFWDGYSVEEVCQDEFDRADDDGNDYLNFTEFRKII